MRADWEAKSEADVARGIEFSMLSLATNAAMGSIKFGVGFVSGSPALMAGALYSINDVLASIAVNVSLRLVGRRPSREFPWGFEKAEFLATLLTGTVLAVAVSGVFVYQLNDLISSNRAPPHITALGVAVVSIVVSGYLYRRAHGLSHELQSPSLHTAAEHSKADAISSIAVVIGVGAATVGLHFVDRIVAIFEIGHIFFLAGELLYAGAAGLMDRSLPKEDIRLIRDACADVDGVGEVLHTRTRRGTRTRWVDVVISVPRELTVSEAHGLATQAADAIGDVIGDSAQSRVRFRAADSLGSGP